MRGVRLKDVARLSAGGTPRIDNPGFWTEDEEGVPWVTIGDMSSTRIVNTTSRRVSEAGIASLGLTPAPAGTILYSMYASVGLVARLGTSAIWNQAILGITPRLGVSARYLAYALDALRPTLGKYLRSNTQNNLNADVVGNLALNVPDEDEQRSIAEFLDAETARVDALVGLRTRQERLLTERLTTTENFELNLGQEMDWASRPLSRLCDPTRPIQYGIVLPGPDVDDGVLLVKGGDVKPERLVPTLLSRTSRDIESGYARSRLQKRDLVFAIRGGVGEVELVPESLIGANITQDVARIAPLPDVDELWLLHALRSTHVQSQAASMVTGATIKGINIGDLRRLAIRVPPPDMQRGIGHELGARSAAYARLSQAIHRQIALLRERRQALITAAVSGGVDVGG